MHRQVEKKRSSEEGATRISDQAYLQVFSMLIEYGILGFEYLHRRRMRWEERERYFNDIRAISLLMEIGDFPEDYHHYLTRRTQMVVRELQFNAYTRELLEAYRKNLGPLRYWGLLQFQALFVEPILVSRLGLKTNRFFRLAYWLYPRLRFKALFKCLATYFLEGKTHLALKEMGPKAEYSK
jgi:hypothetical protein